MNNAMMEKDLEKTHVEEMNKYMHLGITAEEAHFYDNFPLDKKKKLIWKVDIRLIPWLSLLYLAAYIDRANIGNAKIEGLDADLNLTGIQYNIALSLFFVPYILLEVPSNIILKKFKRPSVYMGILVVSWGTVMTLTSLVKGFGGLLACRLVLGITEAGFFPGAVYLITQCALSGAFSGLLAFGIAKMDGIANLPGWAWIFLLEGAFTVCLGVACFFVMPDTPALSGKWLSKEEIKYLEIQNLIREGGRSLEKVDKFRWADLIAIVTDYKIYLQAWILFVASTCSYGLKFTMPSITKNMGYTSSEAQLLTIPPYIVGAISALAFSWFSDRYQWRAPFIATTLTIILVGFAILLPLSPNITNHIAACYIGVVLICIGQYPTNPAGSAWIAGNLAGPSKKAMGIAFNICVGNMGGIVGSYIFLDSEKPGYPTGFGVGLAFCAAAIVSTGLLEYSYWRINRERDSLSEDEVRTSYTEEELAKLGDKSPLFRYNL